MTVAPATAQSLELRTLVQLALPMTLGHWTQMVMHAIDTAMVGRLGVDAVAASSLGNIITSPFFVVVSAVGAALPPLAARALAAGDRVRAERLLRHAWACSALLPLVATAVFAFSLRWLDHSGQSAAVIAQARPYAWLLMASMLPMMLLQNLRGYAEAQGHPWLPLGNIVLGLTVNAGCNVVLIYGLGPVPALGVPGAALGTGIARLAMLGHFLWLLQRRPEVRPSAGWLRRGPWSAEVFGDYLKLGAGTAVVTALVIGSGVVISFWAARLGPAALAAHEIARQIWVLGYVIPFGWSMAVALRIAYWLGRGERDQLRESARLALFAGSGLGLVLAALTWLGSETLPRLFLGGGSPEVAALAAMLLRITAAIFAAEGLFLSAVGVSRGLTQMVPAACAYLGSYWIVGLAAAAWWSAPERLGVAGLWLGIVTGVVPGAVLLALVAWRRASR